MSEPSLNATITMIWRRIMPANRNKAGAGRIEVLHDTNTIINTYVHILNNAKSRWDYFADVRSLSVVPLVFEAIKKQCWKQKLEL
jgi:hypothetical protein